MNGKNKAVFILLSKGGERECGMFLQVDRDKKNHKAVDNYV